MYVTTSFYRVREACRFCILKFYSFFYLVLPRWVVWNVYWFEAVHLPALVKPKGKKTAKKRKIAAAYGRLSPKTRGTLFLKNIYIKILHVSCLIRAKCATKCHGFYKWEVNKQWPQKLFLFISLPQFPLKYKEKGMGVMCDTYFITDHLNTFFIYFTAVLKQSTMRFTLPRPLTSSHSCFLFQFNLISFNAII